MKSDPKVLIPAIPFMIALFMLYRQMNAKAADDFNRKISTEEPAPPAANMHIHAGDKGNITKTYHNKGTVTYSVDIDSSEGYIYLYDKHGRVKDSVHYTAKDMPVNRSAEVPKGETSLEVTRTPASTGTGEGYAEMTFRPDSGAVSGKLAALGFIVCILGAVAVLFIPKKGRGFGRASGRIFMKDGLVNEEFTSPAEDIANFNDRFGH
ncbi:MAG: hypothetical protein J6I96_03870 [Oscillospiraceae bacterium]|nr:hypothetical protein [Oscillospiraceae bacterium]